MPGLLTYVKEVPLSSKTTALSAGAPFTTLETATVLLPTINASSRTLQRAGNASGNVEIGVLLRT
jgi:hypothetical protein